ncbi:MAG: enoyl-CoA hydratase/isomerase family protein [Pyrinomonadaceae bacterium]
MDSLLVSGIYVVLISGLQRSMQNGHDKPIEVLTEKGVAVVRFIRPEIRNPLSIATLEAIEKAIGIIETDRDVQGIVFTGSGGTFAAGADLREIKSLEPRAAREFGERGQNLLQKISLLEKPAVAAIDGYCMGGAFDLALACRFRIASRRSAFAHPGVSLGIITGWGGTQMLPRLIGLSRALEIFLTARKVNADDALKFGLIDRIENNPAAYAVSMLSEMTK